MTKLELTKLLDFLKELDTRKITEAAVVGKYQTRPGAQGVPITDFCAIATAQDPNTHLVLYLKEHIGTAWFTEDMKKLNDKAYRRARKITREIEATGVRVIPGIYAEGDHGKS